MHNTKKNDEHKPNKLMKLLFVIENVKIYLKFGNSEMYGHDYIKFDGCCSIFKTTYIYIYTWVWQVKKLKQRK